MERTAVIIVAGGSGARMGARLPKQFLPVGGEPILMHTIRRFAETLGSGRLIVVLPESHIGYWEKLCREYGFDIPHTVCRGGETRFDSVRCGLGYIGSAEIVAVHDGVRLFVSPDVIRRAIQDAREYGAVIPVVTPVDSLRGIDAGGSHIVARDDYRIVQTPQVFRTKVIRKAYEQPYDPRFTDDASVVEAAGGRIYLCEGCYSNIKITTPVDMLTAEALLRFRSGMRGDDFMPDM